MIWFLSRSPPISAHLPCLPLHSTFQPHWSSSISWIMPSLFPALSFTHPFPLFEMLLSHLPIRSLLLTILTKADASLPPPPSINHFLALPSYKCNIRLFYFSVNLLFVHVLHATLFSVSTRTRSVCSLLCPQHLSCKHFELIINDTDCLGSLVMVYS